MREIRNKRGLRRVLSIPDSGMSIEHWSTLTYDLLLLLLFLLFCYSVWYWFCDSVDPHTRRLATDQVGPMPITRANAVIHNRMKWMHDVMEKGRTGVQLNFDLLKMAAFNNLQSLLLIGWVFFLFFPRKLEAKISTTLFVAGRFSSPRDEAANSCPRKV